MDSADRRDDMSRSKVVRKLGRVYSRSGLERSIQAYLDAQGTAYKYEPDTFAFALKEPGHRCSQCGSADVTRATRYTPDFRIDREFEPPVYLEAKGLFTGRDRRRMLAFKAAYPDKDLRMVFQRDNRLSKTSETTYTDWCEANGFQYHVGIKIPKRWITGESK